MWLQIREMEAASLPRVPAPPIHGLEQPDAPNPSSLKKAGRPPVLPPPAGRTQPTVGTAARVRTAAVWGISTPNLISSSSWNEEKSCG
ncbi:zinc finger protein 268 isoform X7 [Equus asinus]|uniref:zinc finger protein 268 isoform X7 n=1 Tax=Equus asinus TaxID=9793 RepID=UPI0038F67118